MPVYIIQEGMTIYDGKNNFYWDASYEAVAQPETTPEARSLSPEMVDFLHVAEITEIEGAK
jgi:hypothetical protein